MLFFERDARDMQRLTGGNALFFEAELDIQLQQQMLRILNLISTEKNIQVNKFHSNLF